MKLIIVSLFFYSQVVLAEDYYYKVEKKDQLGVILLSLGHKKLWPKDGKVNQFKKSSSLKNPGLISVGDILKINENDVVFKKNITIEESFIRFNKKIKTLPEFDQALSEEGIDYQQIAVKELPKIEVVAIDAVPQNKELEKVVEVEKEGEFYPTPETIHSLNLYPGIGGFVASDKEVDRNLKTDTYTGLQPLVQLKGIYSNSLFGSLAIDLLTKKIITDKFSFPINFDYRLQFLPKWNISDNFKLALSHSVVQHSYVGKSNSTEIAYELKSNFVGVGLVIPTESFWFELYIEKAYTGDTKSVEKTQSTSNGIRFDTDMVYSLYDKWRLIPGINYYKVKDKNTVYSLEVVEARLVFAREFEL